jgi:hypothetical protein
MALSQEGLSPLNRQQLLRLARSGAQARIDELNREIQEIMRAFPDLRARRAGRKGGTASAAPKRSSSAAWTAQKRKAVSDRMKKYWAARRAAKKR